MKILNITTKTGAAVISPATGRPTNYVSAGVETELGYMPGGQAVYVRRVGMTEAQVVPMGSVAKMTVDMPAMGKEVTIVPGEVPLDVDPPPLVPGACGPFGLAVETMREELAAEQRGEAIAIDSRTLEPVRAESVYVPSVPASEVLGRSEQRQGKKRRRR